MNWTLELECVWVCRDWEGHSVPRDKEGVHVAPYGSLKGSIGGLGH